MRIINNFIKLRESSYDEDDDYSENNDFEEEEESKQEIADSWLKNYVLNPVHKFPSKEMLDELLYKYSADSDMKLYRGMNFKTEEEWLSFRNNVLLLKKIKLNQKITSFTTDFKTALQFATTKPILLSHASPIDKKNLVNLEQDKDITGERYGGYKGIIIGIKVPQKNIIDVNKSEYVIEDEYLVLSGEYDIIYFKPIRKYKDVIENPKFNIDKFLSKLTFEDLESSKILSYLVKNNYSISDEAKHNLFNKLLNKINFTEITYQITNPDYKGKDKKIYFDYDFNINFLISHSYLWIPSDYEILKNKVNELLEKIFNILSSDNNYLLDISSYEIKSLMIDKDMSYYIPIKKLLGQKLSLVYNTTNSREEINRINNLPKYEKRKEIDNLITQITYELQKNIQLLK